MIRYVHKNGYSAVLYGEKSMSVYKDRKEIMHTGGRTVNTKEEVMELLGRMPELLKGVAKHEV